MINIDQVTLVNSQDEVVGAMDKLEAHRGRAQLHRAISVYLFRKNSTTGKLELLLQQRSDQKILGAHQWANTVCGNVRPNESYQDCAVRRLNEELGISSVEISPVYKFEYHLQCNSEFSEWEIDQVFVGWYDGLVEPNPAEVQQYAWVDWSELNEQAEKAELQTDSFNTKVVQLATNNQSPTTHLLAPWFVHMLSDPQLHSGLSAYIQNTATHHR